MTSELPPPGPAQRAYSPLIYLVESDPAQAERVSSSLHSNGYQAEIFASNEALVAACSREQAPDVAVMDLDAPGAIPPEGLKAIVFATARDDLAARLAAVRRGAIRYLVKPFDERTLTGTLHELTDRKPQPPYRVLMVDDDPISLSVKSGVLRSVGMTVYTLSDPMKTLDALDHFAPDVLLLDINMPGMNGYELLKIFKADDRTKDIPVIALTANAMPKDAERSMKAGFSAYLTKPIHVPSFFAAIDRYLEGNA